MKGTYGDQNGILTEILHNYICIYIHLYIYAYINIWIASEGSCVRGFRVETSQRKLFQNIS